MSTQHTPVRREHRRSRRHFPLPPPLLLGGIALFLLGVLTGWLLPRDLSLSLSKAPKTPPVMPDWVSVDLLPENEYSRPGTALDGVKGIVVHYVGNPGTTAWGNRSYFENLAETHETHASSHFVIGLEGEIIQCVPLDEIAYCSNDRNHDTISIECCHADESGRFSDATYQSLVRLVDFLSDYYRLDETQVIRHYDVTGKECPRYFVEHEDAWAQFKADVFG